MSHSKTNKNGYSLYIEEWNPAAKKYINTCRLCGHRGYSPVLDEPDFFRESRHPESRYEHRAIYAELTKALPPLPLDELGRCETCARIEKK